MKLETVRKSVVAAEHTSAPSKTSYYDHPSPKAKEEQQEQHIAAAPILFGHDTLQTTQVDLV